MVVSIICCIFVLEKGNNMRTIRTVKDLRELIEQLDDDFVIDFRVRRKLTEEELKNPTEEFKSKINKELDAITFDIISKKKVWFKIINSYDGYRICMYCDNEYNHANGEDL